MKARLPPILSGDLAAERDFMPERTHKTRPAPQRSDEQVAETTTPAAHGEKIKAELDDLLDEIDGVLEENAEEFVKSYVQKGGQ